eukprot:11782495-Ditylum_brightwellii.AAC.1
MKKFLQGKQLKDRFCYKKCGPKQYFDKKRICRTQRKKSCDIFEVKKLNNNCYNDSTGTCTKTQ